MALEFNEQLSRLQAPKREDMTDEQFALCEYAWYEIWKILYQCRCAGFGGTDGVSDWYGNSGSGSVQKGTKCI